MDKLFLTILNMSLTGAFVITAICFARLPLKKAPKIISYCLWSVAGFRLVFPFSIESIFSLIPFNAQPIPRDIAMQPVPRIDSGVAIVDNIISNSFPASVGASNNPLQIWTAIAAYLWLAGVAVMLIYGLISYGRLKSKMQSALCVEANIYESESIKSPFVLGFLAPKIYLPIGLSVHERGYILLHEQTHIWRWDHIVKYTAYFILSLHWFNPFAWAAFLLMGVDMEMSCDESVLQKMGSGIKKEYSLSLLSLATERRTISVSPLAFGEGGIKVRIQNILNFRKPPRFFLIVAVALTAAMSVGFAVNNTQVTTSYQAQEWLDYFLDDKLPWNGSLELELPEYPGTIFRWTPEKVTAIDSQGEKTLFNGMPIWNVYLADLTGDGIPEFCASVSMGSGIVDGHIVVHDYATGKSFVLEDRMFYDYQLYLDNGQLMVKQTKFFGGKNSPTATGALVIENGTLTAIGIDRTRPVLEPKETTAPHDLFDSPAAVD